MNIGNLKSLFEKHLHRLRGNYVLNKNVPVEDYYNNLPPFHSVHAALLMRVRTWKNMFFITLVMSCFVIVVQQKIIFHKLFQKTNEEVVIVPGSPEFFRVRPGQIPDESVFIFSEFIANNLGNFSYRNVKYHFGKISEFMQPNIKGRFEADYSARLSDWSERKVEQSFSYEPVQTFDLVNDKRGSKYVVAVSGTRTQYVEGHLFSENPNVLLLEFRAQGNLTPEKPFIFEIENIEWLSPSQFEAIKNARGLGRKGHES